jgi:hypothetical protein
MDGAQWREENHDAPPSAGGDKHNSGLPLLVSKNEKQQRTVLIGRWLLAGWLKRCWCWTRFAECFSWLVVVVY